MHFDNNNFNVNNNLLCFEVYKSEINENVSFYVIIQNDYIIIYPILNNKNNETNNIYNNNFTIKKYKQIKSFNISKFTSIVISDNEMRKYFAIKDKEEQTRL